MKLTGSHSSPDISKKFFTARTITIIKIVRITYDTNKKFFNFNYDWKNKKFFEGRCEQLLFHIG